MPTITIAVIQTILTELPSITAFIQGLHAAKNPTLPQLTSAEVTATFQALVGSTTAIDEAWKLAHPA